MTGSLKKIGIILIVIILLPGVFFSIYEIGSLSSSEKAIEEIYNNQLDAILFSVNQYAEDLTGSWISKLSTSFGQKQLKPDTFDEEINRLISENPIHAVFLADNASGSGLKFFDKNIQSAPALKTSDNNNGITASDLRKIFRTMETRIDRLVTYKKGGYRKIEAVQTAAYNNSVLLSFLVDSPDSYKMCGVFVDPSAFVSKSLGPKMREISAGRFIISVMKDPGNNIIYSTENLAGQELNLRKQLWLLPGYNLSIVLKGQSIGDLVRYRYYFNLALIILLNFVLIAGVWFVFRNIKKEVTLAQIKSDFVSNVSHELRTPLALISMYAETLEMGRVRTDERKKEYYGIISQEAGRLSRIVNKILSFSQIEAGRRKYSFSEVDLNETAEKIFNTYSFHMQSGGFKFSLEACPDCLPVKADAEAAGEALINLIDNAAKYSGDTKEITVRTGKDHNVVFLEVEDRGIGISAENQKRIFEKFYRVTTGNVHNTKGTGLGLTLVKHIMEAHNGSVTIDSTPGIGSTFRLNFPINNNTAGRA